MPWTSLPGRWVLRYSATMAIASGRKSTLIATLMLMGIATFLVSLVPTYESIGLWGAVIPASGARRCACWARATVGVFGLLDCPSSGTAAPMTATYPVHF